MRLAHIPRTLALLTPLACATAHAAPTAAGPLDDMAVPPHAAQADAAWHDIRVQVVAHNAANLGSPMSGRLAEFPLRDGDRFQQGEILARFVCGEQEGSLAHAHALLAEKREILSTNSKLHNLGTGSGLDFHVAAAQVEEAAADVQSASAQVENCVVKAPFPGRVAGVAVRPYQFVGIGQPLLEILDDRTLDLELIVPSRWLTWLQPGMPFTVSVEETGHTYNATIDRLSGKVDAVSQTIRVFGRLTDAAPELLAGMSGKAALEPPARVGAPQVGIK
jgi:membrane fusion protein (multidrug efflux system)